MTERDESVLRDLFGNAQGKPERLSVLMEQMAQMARHFGMDAVERVAAMAAGGE